MKTNDGIPEAIILLNDLPLQFIMLKEGVVSLKNNIEQNDLELIKLIKVLQVVEEKSQKENIGAWNLL